MQMGEVRKIPLFHCMDWLQGVFYLIFWIWTGGISAKCGIVCGRGDRLRLLLAQPSPARQTPTVLPLCALRHLRCAGENQRQSQLLGRASESVMWFQLLSYPADSGERRVWLRYPEPKPSLGNQLQQRALHRSEYQLQRLL